MGDGAGRPGRSMCVTSEGRGCWGSRSHGGGLTRFEHEVNLGNEKETDLTPKGTRGVVE